MFFFFFVFYFFFSRAHHGCDSAIFDHRAGRVFVPPSPPPPRPPSAPHPRPRASLHGPQGSFGQWRRDASSRSLPPTFRQEGPSVIFSAPALTRFPPRPSPELPANLRGKAMAAARRKENRTARRECRKQIVDAPSEACWFSGGVHKYILLFAFFFYLFLFFLPPPPRATGAPRRRNSFHRPRATSGVPAGVACFSREVGPRALPGRVGPGRAVAVGRLVLDPRAAGSPA
jgi:hypothetical protein